MIFHDARECLHLKGNGDSRLDYWFESTLSPGEEPQQRFQQESSAAFDSELFIQERAAGHPGSVDSCVCIVRRHDESQYTSIVKDDVVFMLMAIFC